MRTFVFHNWGADLRLHETITGTILVADDHPANREFLEELLTSEGFKVVSAQTVQLPCKNLLVRSLTYCCLM